MTDQKTRVAQRFIGLDVHKHYLMALGVDAELQVVLPAQRVEFTRLDTWMKRTLTPQDAVVLEMTTNTWELYDELTPHVHSVTVVHPPHVALITRSQVMTDKMAASILARLLAKGLLVGIWVPPQEVRELRALIAQRSKITRLATQAKNRLQGLLQRHHILPPAGNLFHPDHTDWWNALPLGQLEKINRQSDLETLRFAEAQLARLTTLMNELTAQDDRVLALIHLPGFGVVTAMTVVAAIGEITRFEDAKHLVGYAGLGARIHDSGLTTRTGRTLAPGASAGVTKSGRKDLRAVLVEAAQIAANTHPHWKAELRRLEPCLGRNKAIVAIARKLLVTVWHVLAKHTPDRFAEPESVARKLMQFAYQTGRHHLPLEQPVTQFVRHQLDILQLGSDLQKVPWGKKKSISLPPSVRLEKKVSDVPDT